MGAYCKNSRATVATTAPYFLQLVRTTPQDKFRGQKHVSTAVSPLVGIRFRLTAHLRSYVWVLFRHSVPTLRRIRRSAGVTVVRT